MELDYVFIYVNMESLFFPLKEIDDSKSVGITY